MFRSRCWPRLMKVIVPSCTFHASIDTYNQLRERTCFCRCRRKYLRFVSDLVKTHSGTKRLWFVNIFGITADIRMIKNHKDGKNTIPPYLRDPMPWGDL